MKKHTPLSLITLILLLSSITLSAQHPCMVAWYKFDGNALDNSGNSNHATNYGATNTVDRFGGSSSAYYFNGSTNYVQCPDDFDFQQRTYSVWIKPETFNSNGEVIYASDHSALNYGLTKIMVGVYNGKNVLIMGVASNIFYYEKVYANQWVHAAMSVDLNYIRFYVDGTIKDSMANDDFGHSTNGSTVARIGTNRIFERYFQGTIDDLRIYNCALTSAEIMQEAVSVPENSKLSTVVNIFPLPASDFLCLSTGNVPLEDQMLRIFDASGRLVLTTTINGNTNRIDISGLDKGTYILNFQCNEGQTNKRFIKL